MMNDNTNDSPSDNTRPPALIIETMTPPEKSLPPQSVPIWRNPWAIAAIVALSLAGWQWAETHSKLSATQDELARRLADSDGINKESQILLKQAQDRVSALQARLGGLEAKIDESQIRQTTLESLYQDLARNRDEWMLAEIEQGVTLAAQQLQIAGNVQGALLALQAADVRLAGSNRPQLLGLRRALGHDLLRLRSLPQLDLPGMSLRLENVLAVLDKLPLLSEGRLQPDDKPAAPPSNDRNHWQAIRHLGSEFWADLRNLIRIQRFDRDEPALMAPGQGFFLRENLKLRLLNARLALLARDQQTFRSELKQAQSWMERYFDARNAALRSAQGELKLLMASEINLELPTLNDSLSAIRGFKTNRERK